MDADTLVRHRLPVVIVCGNNGAWGLEKHPMRALYGYLAAWPTMLLIGWNSDRTGERRWHVAASYFACGVGLAGTLFTGGSLAAAIAMFALAAMGINGRLPGFWALPAQFLGGTAAAASIGAINCVGNLGGFVGPYVLGFLSEHSGGSYSSGVLFLSAAAVLGAILVLFVRRESAVERTLVDPVEPAVHQ